MSEKKLVHLEQTDVDRVRAYTTVFQAKVEQQINGGNVFKAFAPIAYQQSEAPPPNPDITKQDYNVLVYVGDPCNYVKMTVAWDTKLLIPALTNVEKVPLTEEQAKKNIFIVLESLQL